MAKVSQPTIRKTVFKRHYTENALGSVLVKAGRTQVLCTASAVDGVPGWLRGKGTGWVTATYGMLPASTSRRKNRPQNATHMDGRTQEIQRLIGRSMRACVDLKRLGDRTIWIDCDVIEADGGTRTAAINGGFVALSDCIESLLKRKAIAVSPLIGQVAAISVGVVDGAVSLDLDYARDSGAAVDMNVVMTASGRFVEVQGTGETDSFSQTQLSEMLRVAKGGIKQIIALQRKALRL